MLSKLYKNLITSLDLEAINDYDLLDILLPNSNKLLPAHFFVNQQGLRELKNKSLTTLITKFKLEQKVALKLLAMLELANRVNKISFNENKKFTSYNNLYNLFKPELSSKKVEEFWVVFLEANGEIIHIDKISAGNFLTTVISTSVIFKEAILLNAKAIVLIHNHPSGSPKPSYEDYELTNNLIKAGKVIEIKVLEHLIIGKDSYYQIVKDTLVNCSSDS